MGKKKQIRLVPFDIKYRKQIESGIYRVFTRDKQPARIICWDGELCDNEQIVAIIDECVETYPINGRYHGIGEESSDFDLFVEILDDDVEYTEFESEVLKLCKAYKTNNMNLGSEVDFVKAGAGRLLSLIPRPRINTMGTDRREIML